jgi:acetyl-CoA carboxylase biotin carboxyl carrier protein
VDLTNDDVADILALLDSLPYEALDLRTDRFRLTLRRAPDGAWTEESELLAEPADATRPAGLSAGAGATGLAAGISGAGRTSAVGGSDENSEGVDGLMAVVAPLPGTFYRAPRPGAPPFVSEGDAVGPATVVAIIETMKLMNSVHAGASGRVARILVENGEFAPLGATLLLIEPGPDASTAPDS